jgi:ribosomal protein S27E
MTEKLKNKIKIRCPDCKYEWLCHSKMVFIMCPSCRKFIKKADNIIK